MDSMQSLKSASQLADTVIKRAEKKRATAGGITGLSTGIFDLDAMTDGLEPGDLMLVVSRPVMGRTALCLQIAGYVAMVEKKPVAIVHYDGRADALMLRIIANQERIGACSLRAGLTAENDWDKFRSGLEKLKESPLYFDAPSQKSASELAEWCSGLCSSPPNLALIIVDDLQGMAQLEVDEPDFEEICRTLKELAVGIGASVIAAAMLPRKLESRRDKRPVLRDLRDWGRPDRYADIICALYRESYYHPECSRDLAELILLKNKFSSATLELEYQAGYCRFEDRFCAGEESKDQVDASICR